MQVTRPVNISVFAPFEIVVTQSETQGYVGDILTIYVDVPVPIQTIDEYDITVNWGDGTIQNFYEAYSTGVPYAYSHQYSITGTRTITVDVQEVMTNTLASDSVLYEVRDVLAANLTANPTSGPAPLNVTFTINTSGGYGPYLNVTLDPGDGSPVYSFPSSTLIHTYTTERATPYTATLTVTDALGLTLQTRLGLAVGDWWNALTEQQKLLVIAGGTILAVGVAYVIWKK